MKQVIKENGSFQLLPEKDQKTAQLAANEHENDLLLLKEDPTLEEVTVVLEHLLFRMREIEKNS